MILAVSSPSISGICTSSRTQVERFSLQTRKRFAAIAGDYDLMSLPLEQTARHLLVDHVILSQQDSERALRLEPTHRFGPFLRHAIQRGFDRRVEAEGEVKCAADPRLALYPDPATHQLRQMRADRQAQTSSTMFTSI